MKNYGALILMTSAVLFFFASEVSSEPIHRCTACPSNWICKNLICYHPCERPIGEISRPCGENARCNKPGQRGADCMCDGGWHGINPTIGCFEQN